jgi:antitoxin (DNA-binding transcriptional repressor) of toxin-antitoxin stability system
VARRGRVVARLVPATSGTARIVWAGSAAARLPRSGKPLTAATMRPSATFNQILSKL